MFSVVLNSTHLALQNKHYRSTIENSEDINFDGSNQTASFELGLPGNEKGVKLKVGSLHNGVSII